MAKQKNVTNPVLEATKNTEINDRFLQIRREMFRDNNTEFAQRIGEDDRVVSAICRKSRSAGQTTILKLLQSMPEIDANWLLTGFGSMTRSFNRENKQSVGDITHSTAVGVNVNGNDINISYDPLLLPVVESLSDSVARMTAQNAQMLAELSRLLNIIEKKP